MKEVSKWAKAAAAAILTMGLGSESMAAEKPGMEKCYGIVKAKMNDCGANGHSCTGQAKKNNDPNEWILLPTGSCNKIVGGTTK